MNLPATTDVVVVGSGVTGAAAAAAVAGRGQRVVLIDKEDGPAREGSGRAQGSLRLQGRHGAEFPLAEEALRLWDEAAEESEFELVKCGNLYFQTRESELPILRRLVAEAHMAGLRNVQLLDADRVREILPAATGPFIGAMYSPIDAQCQPEKGTAHFVEKARRSGADIHYGTKVMGLLQRVGRIAGVDTNAGSVRADAVVLAAGVWTPHLAKTVGLKVPIMPVVLSELETAPVKPLFTQTLRAFGFGARQRPSGKVVISGGLSAKIRHGASLADFNGLVHWLPRAWSFRKNIKLRLDVKGTLRQIRHLSTLDTALVPQPSPEPPVDKPAVCAAHDRLSMVIPELSGVPVGRYWGGLIDMTPDGLPIIDGTAGPEGLTIITGLSGHGFTIGPVLGEIAADLSLDGVTKREIKEFRLSRFTDSPIHRPEMMI
jgi:sarcosine oxidase, subunit beta